MSVYGVALEGLDQFNVEVAKRLAENYPDHYKISDTFFLVGSSPGSTGEISRQAGLRGDNRIEGSGGVVFLLLKRYTGFAASELWEWLDRNFEETE